MEDDIVVKNAAYSLYSKHPEMSAIIMWNTKSQTFDILNGPVEKLGTNSRIQVVGHGQFVNGNMHAILSNLAIHSFVMDISALLRFD